MGTGFKDYIWECVGEAPSAFRRGMIAVTIMANVAILGALFLGWHLNAFTTFQLVSAGVFFAVLEVVVIFPYRRWKSHKAEIERLTDQIAPKLKCSFNMNEPGCVRPNTKITAGPNKDVVATWYRIRVEAMGASTLKQCRGRLVLIERGGSNLLLGETPTLNFSQGDPLSKAISPGVPEYLDFLVANDTLGAYVTVGIPEHLSQAVQWNDIFGLAGDYLLRIVVVSDDSPPVSMDLLFRWNLNPSTSEIFVV